MAFSEFIQENQARIRAGLIAAYGPEIGAEAAADAVAYGWENWDRLSAMANPSGHLFRVGQTSARTSLTRRSRQSGSLEQSMMLPVPSASELPDFEPGLVPALEKLSESQRLCVLLVHAFSWTQAEVAELLDIDHSTVRTHIARGLKSLQLSLEVEPHV